MKNTAARPEPSGNLALTWTIAQEGSAMKITRIEAFQVAWSPNDKPQQHSAFVLVHTDDGLTGIGEASLNGWEAEQFAHVERLKPQLVGKTLDEAAPQLCVYAHSPGGLIASSVISALEQAVTDLRAKQAGLPLHALLGKARRKTEMYAARFAS